MKVLITGGAGFIGSAVCRHLLETTDADIVCLDSLTYAASPATLESFIDGKRARHERVDITDRAAVERVFASHRPDAVMHLAAETHVDRSIDGPAAFIQTNIVGTYVMLDVARAYWNELTGAAHKDFRFHHISTDEVYGSLGAEGAFSETTPYAPNSPYSASKASADHLARAWFHTFGLPVLITNCSNNYGPFQFPEKLIPVIILKSLDRLPLPVYGDGGNVRDWLFVQDHAEALCRVLTAGTPGERYNIGGEAERTNLQVVHTVCDLVDAARPGSATPRRELIRFVTDRPGHDRRYAIDCSKIKRELGWAPRTSFEDGMKATVNWYLGHPEWWQPIQSGVYQGERLGLVQPQAEPVR